MIDCDSCPADEDIGHYRDQKIDNYNPSFFSIAFTRATNFPRP